VLSCCWWDQVPGLLMRF